MSMRTPLTKSLLAGLLALVLAGCASQGSMSQQPMAKKSLYDRLGGLPAIQAVINDFIGNVAADDRINKRFAGVDIPKLNKNLVDQVCEATGGPCKYTGKSMKESHAGMKITDPEFNALVEDLVKSLDKFKVPAAEKNELLAALGGMKKDIVNQ
jgi:hemoglobin